jgi:hypothetical protein
MNPDPVLWGSVGKLLLGTLAAIGIAILLVRYAMRGP